jgi:hypothetical protein
MDMLNSMNIMRRSEGMSDLLKIENIRKKNGDIKAFPLSSNLKRTNHGKDVWGEVTIAIDGVSVERIWNDEVIGVLYIIGREEWEKENNNAAL